MKTPKENAPHLVTLVALVLSACNTAQADFERIETFDSVLASTADSPSTGYHDSFDEKGGLLSDFTSSKVMEMGDKREKPKKPIRPTKRPTCPTKKQAKEVLSKDAASRAHEGPCRQWKTYWYVTEKYEPSWKRDCEKREIRGSVKRCNVMDCNRGTGCSEMNFRVWSNDKGELQLELD